MECEALTVADSLDKARYFVFGYENLVVAVDHKPLLKILGDHSLEQIPNARLRNLKEKTLRYKFCLVHIPGVKHLAADGVSRHPISREEKMTLTDDIYVIHQDYSSDEPQPLPTLPHSSLAGLRMHELDITSSFI